MVKKLKAMAEGAGSDNQLAAAIKESAQQIWLAGLGAFAKTQEEGQKVFQALVREGTTIQKRTVRITEDRMSDIGGRFAKVAGEFQKQANGTWDKLEGVFEERVDRALTRLGVPTRRDVATLTKRVEELTAEVSRLSGKPAKARARKAKTAKSAKTAAA
ncbi:MAG TPA: phasin family protein [Burkholderiaceae bacterium]|nr:phasin family protein [Burkholderiaceae bacterium]